MLSTTINPIICIHNSGNCWLVACVLTTQICVKLLLDGFVAGVAFTRLSRPNKRANSIIFSNSAVIRRINGKLYFMFQLSELRKHQLFQAQVRLYAIRRHVDPPNPLTMKAKEETAANPFVPANTQQFKAAASTPTTAKRSSNNALGDIPEYFTDDDGNGSVVHFQTCRLRVNHPNDEVRLNM